LSLGVHCQWQSTISYKTGVPIFRKVIAVHGNNTTEHGSVLSVKCPTNLKFRHHPSGLHPILQIKVNEKFCFRMPPYCRSLIVWHSAAAKEGKAYEDSTDVV